MAKNEHLNFFGRGFIFWIIFTLLAIIVGWVRDYALVPWFGNWVALFTSGVIMMGIYYAGANFMLQTWPAPRGKWPLLALGLMWSGISFGFEVTRAVLIRGMPFSDFIILYHPKDLFLKGETITLGLTFVIFAPLLAKYVITRKAP